MAEVPTLQTTRFTLRQLGPQDVAPLFPTFADEAAMRWWSRAPFASEAELAEWMLDPRWDGRAWAAVPKEGGSAIGRFVAGPRGPGVAEVGYLVVKERQGEGVARECLAALLAHLFDSEGHARLCRRRSRQRRQQPLAGKPRLHDGTAAQGRVADAYRGARQPDLGADAGGVGGTLGLHK